MSKGRAKRGWKVEVSWEDCTLLGGGWMDMAGAVHGPTRREAVACFSAGYVLAHDRHGFLLAGNVHQSEAAGVTVIPNRQVVKWRRLK